MDGQAFDRLARGLGVRIGRRGAIAGALALATMGGGASATPAGRHVCRPVGAGCTRDSQCCSASCATSRALPRRLRNRCSCPEGLVSLGTQCVEYCDSDILPCVYDLDGDMMNYCDLRFLIDETAGESFDHADGMSCTSDDDCSDLPHWMCVGANCRCVTATVIGGETDLFAPVCAIALEYCG